MILFFFLFYGISTIVLHTIHSHNDINHNVNTNTHKNTGGLCRFRYERFINFCFSPWRDRRET